MIKRKQKFCAFALVAAMMLGMAATGCSTENQAQANSSVPANFTAPAMPRKTKGGSM